jgi:hypothetical protein
VCRGALLLGFGVGDSIWPVGTDYGVLERRIYFHYDQFSSALLYVFYVKCAITISRQTQPVGKCGVVHRPTSVRHAGINNRSKSSIPFSKEEDSISSNDSQHPYARLPRPPSIILSP